MEGSKELPKKIVGTPHSHQTSKQKTEKHQVHNREA
jgi:hypothetical protein